MLVITKASQPEELEQILLLQQKNLARNISRQEAIDQGYVTVIHTPDQLQKMHQLAPAILAKDDEKVVGYALSMPISCSKLIPVLEPMFASFENLDYKTKPLKSFRYYVMGQVCIDKEYRAQGIFDRLYAGHKENYSPQYDCIVTEVATRNTRSLRAHQRVGFSTIHKYRDETDDWEVLVWDWN